MGRILRHAELSVPAAAHLLLQLRLSALPELFAELFAELSAAILLQQRLHLHAMLE
jgi:hypothetical protein